MTSVSPWASPRPGHPCYRRGVALHGERWTWADEVNIGDGGLKVSLLLNNISHCNASYEVSEKTKLNIKSITSDLDINKMCNLTVHNL